jgi:predicted ATPase
MASIDRIIINGFKSIKEMDIKLLPINILIGANGSGKSNFISIFKLINAIFTNNLSVFSNSFGGASRLLHFGKKYTSDINLKVFASCFDYECELVSDRDDNLVFRKELTKYLPDEHVSSQNDEIHKHSIVSDLKYFSDFQGAGENMWVYHFNDTSESSAVFNTCKINDNLYLKPDGSNIAAYLYMLKETNYEYYARIIDIIRLVTPFFNDFRLRPNPLNKDVILIEWSHKNNPEPFPLSSLSDGTLRFICLVVLLMQPKNKMPSTILLDEPEMGLHPYALYVLAGMIRSVSSHTQILVSTQSVTLLNHFSVEDIIIAERENGQSVFRRCSEEQLGDWLEEYSIGELWEKNIFGGRP